jgi:predicted metal-dependent HD superfamily phosphohydrolase
MESTNKKTVEPSYKTLFRQVHRNLELDEKYIEHLYGDWNEKYSGRPYHNLTHIAFMLKRFKEYRKETTDFDKKFVTPSIADAFHLAILYHDVVHDAKGNNNEKLSSRYLDNHLKRNVQKKYHATLYYAQLLIETTAEPRELLQPAKFDNETDFSTFVYLADLLHDLDYAILGTPARHYEHYLKSIEHEYKEVEDFDELRVYFAISLVIHYRKIFKTKYFRTHYFDAAIRNLTNEYSVRLGREENRLRTICL